MLASAAGRTTLLHLDHMNDYKGYTKACESPEPEPSHSAHESVSPGLTSHSIAALAALASRSGSPAPAPPLPPSVAAHE